MGSGLILLGTANDHWAVRVVDDIITDTSHDGTSQFAQASCAHHNVVCFGGICHTADEFSWLLNVK